MATTMRSDISFAMSKLSRFVSNLGDAHCFVLERVTHYWKCTLGNSTHCIMYPKVQGGYSDSN